MAACKPPKPEWFDYSQEDLVDPEKREEVFQRMIDILETNGKCRYVFHQLAHSLGIEIRE